MQPGIDIDLRDHGVIPQLQHIGEGLSIYGNLQPALVPIRAIGLGFIAIPEA